MSVSSIPHVDVAVFGAGIAGLWTLARLLQAGYNAALFERHALGGVQSIASQGIIHGGTKYALTGKLTGSAMAIGEMPGIWRAALLGDGEIDLRGVRVLSDHQYLWTSGSLASGLAGFFAGKVMQSRMRLVGPVDYPAPFDAPGFHGSLYRLDEPVLDPHSLMQVLAERLGERCFLLQDPLHFERTADGWRCSTAQGTSCTADALVLAAGRGNNELLSALGRQQPRMQTRPLHMLMLRGNLPLVTAHCLGASATPRLTITSYPLDDGRVVWYLGGQVAEQGIRRSPSAQIQAGRDELAELLPWVCFDDAEWAALKIDRAEIETAGGRRPDDAFVDTDDGVVTCWPTKLAFAPRVAKLVLAELSEQHLKPTTNARSQLDLPQPPLARLPWDEVATWT